MIHNLKTLDPYFSQVCSSEKRFELRRDDRGYSVGDYLLLRHLEDGKLTGRVCPVKITHILRDVPEYGLASAFCIMSIEIVSLGLMKEICAKTL